MVAPTQVMRLRGTTPPNRARNTSYCSTRCANTCRDTFSSQSTGSSKVGRRRPVPAAQWATTTRPGSCGFGHKCLWPCTLAPPPPRLRLQGLSRSLEHGWRSRAHGACRPAPRARRVATRLPCDGATQGGVHQAHQRGRACVRAQQHGEVVLQLEVALRQDLARAYLTERVQGRRQGVDHGACGDKAVAVLARARLAPQGSPRAPLPPRHLLCTRNTHRTALFGRLGRRATDQWLTLTLRGPQGPPLRSPHTASVECGAPSGVLTSERSTCVPMTYTQPCAQESMDGCAGGQRQNRERFLAVRQRCSLPARSEHRRCARQKVVPRGTSASGISAITPPPQTYKVVQTGCERNARLTQPSAVPAQTLRNPATSHGSSGHPAAHPQNRRCRPLKTSPGSTT